MKIADFTVEHIEQATRIARMNYETERGHALALPPADIWPGLDGFAKNGLGVSALDGDRVIGFLCCYPPFTNAFRSTDAVGVFSPMHANGTIPENRANIYARMYQVAGGKWAEAGASSHAVCLYAHDKAGQEQFFRYGFGLRCVDAIRGMDGIIVPPCAEGYSFAELASDEFLQILPFDHMLDAHMAESPCFILRPSETGESFAKMVIHSRPRYFVARKDGQIAAYIRAELDGETFICDMPHYLHVKGAFCLPEHRGKGVYANLLSLLVRALKADGYTRLGVDFESINPTAYGFWLKYFTAYTHGLVRRIDEHVLKGRQPYKNT